MGQYSQQQAIAAARAYYDDAYDSKIMFQFSPLQGNFDGTNPVFQIPQERMVVLPGNNPPLVPNVFLNDVLISFGIDFIILNQKASIIQFVTAPPNNFPIPSNADDVKV